MSSETIEPAAEIDVPDAVRVACMATEYVSLAYYENAIAVIREIVVANPSDEDLVDLRVRIASQPTVVQPLTLRFDRVPADPAHHV